MSLEERKRCITCDEFLIAFQGHYMHKTKPCAGVTDAIDFEAVIVDNFLNKKFVEMYGEPSIDDVDRLTLLEKELLTLHGKVSEYAETLKGKETLLNRPFIKFILKLLHKL